jgi:hypothetical protein
MSDHRYYLCRRCGALRGDWETFAAGSLDRPRYYCLDHIPRWSRLKLRIREVFGDA